MRRLRIQYSIFIILAFLSIMSVGFASWVTANDSSFEINGSIIVDDVRSNNEYLECDETQIEVFEFFKTGFVSNDGEIIDTGEIYIPFTVKVNNCRDEFKNSSKLEIVLNFTTTNMNLFVNDPLNMSIVLKNNNDEIIKTIASTKDGLLSFEISGLQTISNNIDYKLYYQFTKNEIEKTFKDDVYPELLKDGFTFQLNAKITGSD
mgnify:FL=1